MQPRFFILPLLFFAFISLNMTCNQTVPNTDKPTEEVACIDKSKINPNKGCPRILAPVCGCDGKTYGNSCEADKNGVTEWNDGKCNDCIDKSKINPNAPCTKEYVPVCGCDEKTYANKCEAARAGLREWVSGKCKTNTDDSKCIDESKINPDLFCMKIYRPVCGCDEKTYGNTCEAEKAGVTKWTEGKCDKNQKKDCIDPAKIRAGDCPDEYAPVCGCNEITYSNVCKAKLAGVTKWVEGKCK